MHTTILSPERLTPTDLLVPEAQQAQPVNFEVSSVELLTPPSGTPAVGEITCNTDAAQERPRLRDRFFRSRVGRLALTSLASLGFAGGAVAVEASPAYAANPVYTVVNPDNDGTRSIYDRNSPRWADSNRKAPDFSYYGDRLELICGTNGEAIGPYNNKRWHYAKNLSRPEAGVTWIPDRYMNTPNKANQPTPGEKECGATESNPPTPTKTKACYFNLRAPSTNLTFSYGGNHRYLGNAWQAAKNWTDAGTGVTVKQGSGNTYVRFADINSSKSEDAWYASAVIPATKEWQGPYTSPPKNPHVPSSVTIKVNQRYMDKLDDKRRTYALAHEIGHALGLAHTNVCGVGDESIMKAGGSDVPNRTFNTPRAYDKIAIRQLYGTS